MRAEILNRIKRTIAGYFTSGKADKIRTEGFDEVKSIIRRNGGLWKDYKGYMTSLVNEVSSGLQRKFESEHLQKLSDAVKSQLAEIINRTRQNFKGAAEQTQKIIKDSLEKSYTEGGNWETYARRGFRKIKLEDRHIRTEIETTKAALHNLKRYHDFAKAADEEISYRYEGPATNRPFCVEHLSRVYSLSELQSLRNRFGQPAFAFAGGYNCRHRWAPVIGERTGNMFVGKSWQEKFDKSSKNEKKVMQRELSFAQKASAKGYRTELNYSLRNIHGKDTDLIFDGKYAQLKQPVTGNINSLGRLPRSDQADLTIVEISKKLDVEDYKRLLGKYKKFTEVHNDKEILVYYENNFTEVKND